MCLASSSRGAFLFALILFIFFPSLSYSDEYTGSNQQDVYNDPILEFAEEDQLIQKANAEED